MAFESGLVPEQMRALSYVKSGQATEKRVEPGDQGWIVRKSMLVLYLVSITKSIFSSFLTLTEAASGTDRLNPVVGLPDGGSAYVSSIQFAHG